MGIRLLASLLILTAGFWGNVSGFFGFGNSHDDDDRHKKSFWERTFNKPIPLPDDVVLFGEEELEIKEESNILGGNVATNNRADLGRDVFAEGSLLADKADLDRGTTIAGNLEASRIEGKDYTINGETIKPRKTKDYELPSIQRPDPGRHDIRIKKKEEATINPGRYDKLSIDREAVVTVEPGTYELERLHVDRDVTLILTGPTMFLVDDYFSFNSDTMVDLRNDLQTTDVQWHYRGNSSLLIGKRVFGAGEVIATRAKIHVRDETTWRGRLIGEEVKVGRDVTISVGTAFNVPSRAEDVVEDPEGGLIIVNEILINLSEDAPAETLAQILEATNGMIVGHINISNEYKIRIESGTVQELEDTIQAIEALGVEGVEVVSKNGLVYPD
jgi:hypothetical protein